MRNDLAIKPVESDEELRLANDLIAREHNGSEMARYWIESCGARYPGHEPEHTRIAVWKGEVAGALRIATETMRIGEARLRVGGLGWLTTAPRHRGRGIASLLMQDAFAYLKQHRYHLSLIFGNHGIFRRYGFVNTLAEYSVQVDGHEAARFESPFKARPAKPGDIPALQKIHAANDSETDCSILRTQAHLTNKWHQCVATQVLTDPQGKVLAYYMPRDEGDFLAVDEVGVADPGVCAGVLGSCAALAAEKGFARLRFQVPPPHPFARFLLQFPSVHETHILAPGAGMMALVDVGETLENMLPEWESLLFHSGAGELRSEVTLVVENTPFRIRANRGAVDVAAAPGRNKVSLNRGDLIHLLTGYRQLSDVLAGHRALLNPEGRTLLKSLFPKRTPYVWMFDRC